MHVIILLLICHPNDCCQTPTYHYLLTESLVVEMPFPEIPVTKLNLAITESQCIAIKGTFNEFPKDIPALASATVFLLLKDEQAPSLNLAEGRCRRQRPEAVTRH